MSRTASEFDQRLRRLDRKHARLAENGYVRKMGKNGLLVLQPRRRGPTFPLRGLIMVFIVAFVFKGFLLASMGDTVYADRVDALKSGSLFEKAGAWMMQPDTATRGLASGISFFFD